MSLFLSQISCALVITTESLATQVLCLQTNPKCTKHTTLHFISAYQQIHTHTSFFLFTFFSICNGKKKTSGLKCPLQSACFSHYAFGPIPCHTGTECGTTVPEEGIKLCLMYLPLPFYATVLLNKKITHLPNISLRVSTYADNHSGT